MEEKTRFLGKFLRVTTELGSSNGSITCYERAYVRDGVTIIVITPNGDFRFVKELLWTTKKIVTKLVTGYIEDGEDPLTAAKRELEEELGLKADTWREYLVTRLQGAINRTRHHFIATGISQGVACPDATEHFEQPVDLNIDTVRNLALDGSFGTSESAYVLLRLIEELSVRVS